jgi:hypothetical protein
LTLSWLAPITRKRSATFGRGRFAASSTVATNVTVSPLKAKPCAGVISTLAGTGARYVTAAVALRSPACELTSARTVSRP